MTSEERHNEEKHLLILSAFTIKNTALKNNENSQLDLIAFAALAPSDVSDTFKVQNGVEGDFERTGIKEVRPGLRVSFLFNFFSRTSMLKSFADLFSDVDICSATAA